MTPVDNDRLLAVALDKCETAAAALQRFVGTGTPEGYRQLARIELDVRHAMAAIGEVQRTRSTDQANDSADAQRTILLNLAAWVETTFELANRPKVTARTEADCIYSEILLRIGQLQSEATNRLKGSTK
jgi:hypothetical protein